MNVSERQKAYDSFHNVAYYVMIGIISILATAFVPMLGSEIGLEFVWPTTVAGWAVWILTKVSVAIINILIFHCFMEQAKVNVKDEEQFKKANEILHKLNRHKQIQPMSPKKWNTKQYTSKGTTIFLGSIVSAIGLTSAILKFDLISFLTYTFTVLMGLVFGYLQMRKAENYWTVEYYDYALMKEKELAELEEQEKKRAAEEAIKQKEAEEQAAAFQKFLESQKKPEVK